MASEKWILQRVTKTPGRGSTTCWRWRWYGVEEGEVLETTTDSTMRNWHTRGWRELSEDPCPWGVYENIHASSRKTNQGVGVANADYRPVLMDRVESQEQAEYLVRGLKESRKQLAVENTFDNLFE